MSNAKPDHRDGSYFLLLPYPKISYFHCPFYCHSLWELNLVFLITQTLREQQGNGGAGGRAPCSAGRDSFCCLKALAELQPKRRQRTNKTDQNLQTVKEAIKYLCIPCRDTVYTFKGIYAAGTFCTSHLL